MNKIKRWPKSIPYFHLWVVIILFVIGIILLYPQETISWHSSSLFSFLGLTRHEVERIFFLLPVSFAAFYLGTNAGWISLAATAVIMLPRVFLVSDYFADALFETTGIILMGLVGIFWFTSYKKEKIERQRILSNLENALSQLQSHAMAIEKREKQLLTINRISRTVSQSLDLKQILDNAINSVIDLMQVDAAWIYLLNPEKTELSLVTHRGYSDEFSRVKVGYGISGKVVASMQSIQVEDVTKEASLPEAIRRQMTSLVVVPLNAKGRVNGTLGVHSRSRRYFDADEVELLTVIGNEIGVAVDNAKLYENQIENAEKLRVSEQRYRELFENAQDAIWIHDMDGNLETVNRAAEKLVGYTLEELIGMNVRHFLDEESLKLSGQIRYKLINGETVEEPYEQRIIRKNGTACVLKLTTNLIKNNGVPVGFLGIARDVTREKELQDRITEANRELTESLQQLKDSQQQLIQAEKLTSLGQLAASIAHEVNNPLSGILMYTQLLIKKLRNDKLDSGVALNYLTRMEFELARSTNLIKNLLDFARQSSPKYQNVNLKEIINRSLDLAGHAAELQHVTVINELDPALPDLTADADQLLQVFTNLILNAIQAMSQGGSLSLHSTVYEKQVRIDVQDTGTGISPENMVKLFTPFFTTRREIKGVGLGLAISYGIIQRHGGKIEVESKVGKGTTFKVYLPIHLDAPPA